MSAALRDRQVVAPSVPAAQVFALADHAGTPPGEIVRDTTAGGHLGLFMGHEALSAHWPPLLAAVRARSR